MTIYRYFTFVITIALFTALLTSCSSGGSGSSPTGDTPQLYDVKVSMSPSDGGTISPSADSSYEEGTQISLQATTNEGYTFVNWSGDVDTTANPYSFTVNKNYSITANFQLKSYELTVNTTGEGTVTEQIIQQKTYDHGTTVELTANPVTGWKFVEWQGDVTGTTNPVQITVDNPKTVTAVFEKKSYELTVNISGEGAVSEEIVKAKSYEYGTTVELTANPSTGWKFVEWLGDLTGTQNPIQITVDTTKTVTAVFEKKTYAVNVSTSGEGTVSKSPDQTEYEYNSIVDLTANPATGWKFVQWQGDVTSTQNPLQITVDTTKNITAVFDEKTFAVNVSTSGDGTVSKSPDQAEYQYNSTVDLTATPSKGWKFVEWQGDVTGTQNPIQIMVDTTKNITAVFEKKSFAVNVSTSGEGSVTKSPDQAEYKYNSTVDLTANPATGWKFVEWQGDTLSTSNPLSVTVDTTKNFTAVFEKKNYTLTVNTSGSGSVTKNPDQTEYLYGTLVDLTASPDAGWEFDTWDGDTTSTDNPITVSIDSAITVTAVFTNPTFAGGNGTQEYPYQVSTVDQLQAVKDYPSANFIQINDIDASATSTWNGGAGFNPIGDNLVRFQGSYDGSNYIINGLSVNRPSENRVGLFGHSSGALIRNVKLENANITGGDFTGGLIGILGENSTIRNVSIGGDISGALRTGGLVGNSRSDIYDSSTSGTVKGGDQTGGLVGDKLYGVVSNSHSSATVDGAGFTGGLVGFHQQNKIIDSYATGDVTGTSYLGGLVGKHRAVIENSYSTGNVNGDDYIGGLAGYVRDLAGGRISQSYANGIVNGRKYVGGLVGTNEQGIIEDSYGAGDVTGTERTGGLVGDTWGKIINSYALGSVNGDLEVGGLVGVNRSSGDIDFTYASGTVSGTTDVGGLIGVNGADLNDSYWDYESTGQADGIGRGTKSGATGLSTSEMTGTSAETNMSAFDFVNIWVSTSSYPALYWE